MKQTYQNLTFNASNAGVIEHVDSIVEEYQAQGFRMTVRQVYYQMIARDLLPESWIDPEYNAKNGLPANTKNTVKNYKRLAGLINDAKLAGLLDWDAMEDITREFESLPHWTSGADILNSAVHGYHEDLWSDQEHRVFVIVEKDALLGVLRPTCRSLDVPLMAARGYASSTVLREFALRDVVPALQEDKHAVVLHLGDHDPSGIDMTRDLETRIAMFTEAEGPFDREFTLKRIALSMAQVKEVGAPENPAKTTDARFKGYVAKYGEASWELDALKPDYLDRLVRRHVAEYCDAEKFKAREAKVAAEKVKLREVAKKWDSV